MTRCTLISRFKIKIKIKTIEYELRLCLELELRSCCVPVVGPAISSYDINLFFLKKKEERVTSENGGVLTEAMVVTYEQPRGLASLTLVPQGLKPKISLHSLAVAQYSW